MNRLICGPAGRVASTTQQPATRQQQDARQRRRGTRSGARVAATLPMTMPRIEPAAAVLVQTRASRH